MSDITEHIEYIKEEGSKLTPEEQLKLEVIQNLLEPCDRTIYGQKLKEAAERLGVSVRSVQRLFKQYQQEGLSALTTSNTVRSLIWERRKVIKSYRA